MLRQFDAILGTGSLLRYTRRITAPTVVIHGTDDPMVRPRNGRNLARAIPTRGSSSSTAWATTCPSRCGARSWRRSPRTSPWPAEGGYSTSASAWSTTTSRSSPRLPVSHCWASSAMAPVKTAAPTAAATGSEPGMSRPPSVSTPSRSSSCAAARRASQHRIGAGLGEQHPAAARVGRAEAEHGGDAGPRARPHRIACFLDRGLDHLAELHADPVVDRPEQLVDVGEALVEVAGVQAAFAADRAHRHRGLALVAEQPERRVDQQRRAVRCGDRSAAHRPTGSDSTSGQTTWAVSSLVTPVPTNVIWQQP